MINYSIIVAVFNGKQYIKRCIESVISQRNADFELIIVDDGSTDGTSEICDIYKNTEKVKVIHQENKGHTVARKRGLFEAKGIYIIFLDADDWLSDDFLIKIEDAINGVDVPPDIVSFNYNRIDENGICNKIFTDFKSGLYDKQSLNKQLYPYMLCDSRKQFYTFGVFPTLWSKLFKRKIILNVINMLDDRVVLGEDAFCVFLSLYRCENLLIMDECLYNYQINSQSLSRKYAKDNFEKLSILCNLMDSVYPKELRTQVLQYKLSMLMGAITNETRGPKKTRDIIIEIKERCEENVFSDCVKNTKVSHMPFFRVIIWNLLKMRLYSLLVYILRILKA
ncbi:glycosyltransferase family 2 protein [Lachnospiraceae bacterium 48-21]